VITHILFPFDFSPEGSQVVPFVRALSSSFGAKVTLLTVIPPSFEEMPAGMGPRSDQEVTDLRRALQARLDQTLVDAFAGLPIERTTEAGDPGFRITDFAHRHGVDLIMMPTHGLGLFRSLLIGSATSKVLHDSRCPVWTAAHTERQRARELPRTILCAVDTTPEGPRLLRWAADFSAQVGATLKLLHVADSITDASLLQRERELQEQVRLGAQQQVASIEASAGIDAPLRVAVGDVASTVAEEARAGDADLIVIGRGSLQSPLGRLRTHAYGIIQRSPCPVLSV
jgi:nucleotide-binding universal stress UspA family protein